MMKQHHKTCPDQLYSDWGLIEQFYAHAFWALEAGATKEELLEQLEAAFECVSARNMASR